MTLRAAVFHGAGDIRVEDVPDPRCGHADVVIRVEACGICGTDIHAYSHGATPFAAPGQVLGHEFAGSIVEVGAEVDNVSVGDRVTAWPIVHCDECPSCLGNNWHLCTNALGRSISSGEPGAFAQFVRIPRARLRRTLYTLPPGVDWTAGALVEPMSVGLHAASFAAGDSDTKVLVSGLGPIGLCVVQALRLARAHIIGVDPSSRRRQAALQLGAELVFDPSDGKTAAQLREATSNADAVCECSGAERALTFAIETTRPGGTVVLVGLYGRTLALAPDPILMRELRVQGVYAYRTEYQQALALLASGDLLATPLISHSYPLDRISEAFATQANAETALKVMITPNDEQ
jgi:threonine dehydrogenase-like Zn-dependent dehydrogenase